MAKKKDLQEPVLLKLTSAIALDGEVVPAGELIEVTDKEAKNLLHRGRAVLASAKDRKKAGGSGSGGDRFDGMTVPDLKAEAEKLNVEGFANMNKAQLLEEVRKADAAAQ